MPRLANALEQEKQRLEYILDAIHCATWEWNLETDQVQLDERWAQMLGYRLEELQPVTSLTAVIATHPDDLHISAESARNHIAGLSARYHCEIRVRHKLGHWIWVQDSGLITERDANGVPLKMLGARQDITARKTIEERLKREGQRFKALATASGSGVWEWDSSQQKLWCSSGYFDMLGRSSAEFGDHTCLKQVWSSLLHPDDRERAQQLFADYLAGDTRQMYESEFRLLHADGSWVWVVSRGRTLLDEHGQPGSLTVGAHIDITSLKQTQASLLDSQLRLEQRVSERTAELRATLDELQRAQDELLQSEKLASLGALVAGVAHELNTPIGNALMVASAFAQTNQQLEQQLASGLTKSALGRYMDEIQEGSLIIERNLGRAAELIGSFKQLAVDQTSYQRRSFDLRSLSHEISITMQPTLRKTPFMLKDRLCEGVVLDSYPGPLGQVLINLINNALIHAFEGRDHGTICLSCTVNDGWLALSVSDDGKGIAEDNRKKVFDPFFTTQLGQGGSGLGLHIAYSLVTGLLGGRIELHSQEGQGSEFILHLPLVAPR